MKRQNQNETNTKESLFKILRGKQIHEEQKEELNLWYNSLYQQKENPYNIQEIKKESFRKIQIETAKNKYHNFYVYRFAAAVIALVLVASFILFNSLDWFGIGNSSETVAWQTYQTEKGERTSIILPDSSEVFLSANSRISIPDNFLSDRKVKLVGLAFFNVKSLDGLPFEVETAKLKTAVLGTSFNIHAPENGEEKVEVKSGKVKVKQSQGNKYTTLTKGQRVFTNKNNLFSALISNKDEAFSWINNTLFFNNITISEMADKIEDWYGVEVMTQEEFNTCRITGKYHNQSLEEVLEIINYSIHLKHKWENETLIIEKVTCK